MFQVRQERVKGEGGAGGEGWMVGEGWEVGHGVGGVVRLKRGDTGRDGVVVSSDCDWDARSSWFGFEGEDICSIGDNDAPTARVGLSETARLNGL